VPTCALLQLLLWVPRACVSFGDRTRPDSSWHGIGTLRPFLMHSRFDFLLFGCEYRELFLRSLAFPGIDRARKRTLMHCGSGPPWGPISLRMVWAVITLMPGTFVRSTPTTPGTVRFADQMPGHCALFDEAWFLLVALVVRHSKWEAPANSS
jgi:hypothetical protein